MNERQKTIKIFADRIFSLRIPESLESFGRKVWADPLAFPVYVDALLEKGLIAAPSEGDDPDETLFTLESRARILLLRNDTDLRLVVLGRFPHAAFEVWTEPEGPAGVWDLAMLVTARRIGVAATGRSRFERPHRISFGGAVKVPRLLRHKGG